MRWLAQVPSAYAIQVGVAAALACWAAQAIALPPGRAWTPMARLDAPGFGFTVAPRLELDEPGRPFLITLTRVPSDVLGLEWADSAWVQRWRFGRGSIALWPVHSPPGTHYLVWRGLAPVGDERLFMAKVLDGGIQEPDTVASVALSTEYSGAVSARRRWVTVSDVVANTRRIRVLYSDTAMVWRDAPVDPRPFDITGGVAMASTGDSTALIAWAESFRLRWATLEGTRWLEGPPFPDRDAFRMQFRERPSGGQWLASASSRYVILRSHYAGAWSPPETLQCAYRDGLPNHLSDTPDLSRDAGEYPAVVWDAQNIRANNTICVCVPTDSGYGVAEELEGVEGNLGLPTVARDRNGDVWVAWFVVGGDVRWIHSYTRATAGTPRVEGHGRHRRVAWTLSEPAPETWWAVLRARGSEGFEEVARVRAGAGVEMSWADASPPAGLLRYKIRRESVDVRYLWESEVARVPERSRGLVVRLQDRRPVVDRVALELEHAAPGPFEVSVFDVQGRMVSRIRGTAAGYGVDTIVLDLAADPSPPNGVYFAEVKDARGEVGRSARIVVLR